MSESRDDYTYLMEALQNDGVDVEDLLDKVRTFRVGVGDWCTLSPVNRFRTVPLSGGARSVMERIDDLEFVKRITGCADGHTINVFGILSEYGDGDYSEVVDRIRDAGLSTFSVMPNSAKDPKYASGSFTSKEARVRDEFLEQCEFAVDVAQRLQARSLSLWFADGTNVPGQDDFRQRKQLLSEGIARTRSLLDKELELHLEYKLFEPATYQTDIADWGMAYVFAKQAGPGSKVLMDVGHHALGTNVEHIAAFLRDEDMLGSLHFNSKKYADDDLSVGSINPYELFLILAEALRTDNGRSSQTVPHITLDEFHYVKLPVAGIIQSVCRTQELAARVYSINWRRLKEYQQAGETVLAECELQRAFYRDMTPLLQRVREEANAEPTPIDALYRSDYYGGLLKSRTGRGE